MGGQRRLVLEDFVTLQTLEAVPAELGGVFIQGHGGGDGRAGRGRYDRPGDARLDFGDRVHAGSRGAREAGRRGVNVVQYTTQARTSVWVATTLCSHLQMVSYASKRSATTSLTFLSNLSLRHNRIEG